MGMGMGMPRPPPGMGGGGGGGSASVRSPPTPQRSGQDSTMGSSNGGGGGGAQLGGLFAGGMPKLKPTGNRMGGNGMLHDLRTMSIGSLV
eukprot:jgi/Hompol1/4436/HPOL_001778-RA